MTYEELAQEWENNNALLCSTSGSTGIPKKILIDKKYLLDSATRTADFFKLDSSSLLYSCISPDFIGGKMMLVRQRLLGCRLKWENPSNRPLADVTERISLLSVVPSQMIHILDNIDKMPQIDNILVGGSAIPATLRKRIAESGLNAFESYGMTETASHIALRRIEELPSPFLTLGDITVSEQDGALCISIPGWKTIVTNDCAEVLNPKEFYIKGRKDNIIISGGRKINPEIIEEKLSSHIDIPFYIASMPDEKWGERIVLIAENADNDDVYLMQHIRTICERMLKNYEKPKEIYLCPVISRTLSGKVIRINPDDIPGIKFSPDYDN